MLQADHIVSLITSILEEYHSFSESIVWNLYLVSRYPNPDTSAELRIVHSVTSFLKLERNKTSMYILCCTTEFVASCNLPVICFSLLQSTPLAVAAEKSGVLIYKEFILERVISGCFNFT